MIWIVLAAGAAYYAYTMGYLSPRASQDPLSLPAQGQTATVPATATLSGRPSFDAPMTPRLTPMGGPGAARGGPAGIPAVAFLTSPPTGTSAPAPAAPPAAAGKGPGLPNAGTLVVKPKMTPPPAAKAPSASAGPGVAVKSFGGVSVKMAVSKNPGGYRPPAGALPGAANLGRKP